MSESGAAVVAAQLLAFYREPVRYRPRLTQGREVFPGGLTVFRFAQGRFPHNIVRDLPPPERERLREAAVFFIRQVCFWSEASHYQVLCVPSDARRELIKEHYHALMALIHPDRPEAAAGPWPAGAAQRVNQAYDALCDDERRREYDCGLRKSPAAPRTLEESLLQPPHTAAVHLPLTGKRAAARIRYRRPALVMMAAVASLFFFQVWWAGEVPRDLSLLPSAVPFDVSTGWMRDALSSDRPRYIASGEASRTARSPASADEVPVLTPLWRALSRRASEQRPAPPAEAPEPRPERSLSPALVAATAAIAAPPAPSVAAAPPPALKPAEALRPQLAQAPAETPRAATVAPRAGGDPAPAQALQALPPPRDEGISPDEMEMLVARLVTYYEAGDLDKLLGLYDAASVSVWEALRLRHEFQEFFRTTRGRRLRLTKVSWETEGRLARARGEAKLVAESVDEAGRIERTIKLEIEATAREGQPRITRLTLFPYGG